MNIDPWKRRANTPDGPIFNRVSLRSDESDYEIVLRVCNLNLAAKMQTTVIFHCSDQISNHLTPN